MGEVAQKSLNHFNSTIVITRDDIRRFCLYSIRKPWDLKVIPESRAKSLENFGEINKTKTTASEKV